MDVYQQWDIALGLTVVEGRRALGLNQADFAANAGLSTSQVSLVERGAITTNVTAMLRMSQALGLTPAEFWTQVSAQMDALSARAQDTGIPMAPPRRRAGSK